MSMDRRIFFDRIRPMFGGRLTQPQVEGMDAILNTWENRDPGGDLRWLAYIFATTFHETARTMQPVREAYWLSESWRRRNLSYYPYYGRGYVQLTHAGNYDRAGRYLGVDLVRSPDLAMVPGYAATVIFVGMQAGWFRGDSRGRHTLARYFNQGVNDPVGAREIVNGREIRTEGGRRVLVASIIARYHDIFLSAVSAAARAGVGIRRGLDATMPEFEDEVFNDGYVAPPAVADGAAVQRGPLGEAAMGIGDEVFDLPAPQFPPMLGVESIEPAGPDNAILLEHTVEIVTAFVGSGNKLDAAELPGLVSGVYRALAGVAWSSLSSDVVNFDIDLDDLPEPDDAPAPEAAAEPIRRRSRSSKPREKTDGLASEHA